MYWNRRFKFYFVNQLEWNDFLDRVKNVKLKRVTHLVEPDSKIRPKTTYFPVTMPRTFRRSFTLLKIKNEQIWTYKNVR